NVKHVQLVVSGTNIAVAIDHKRTIGPAPVLAHDGKRTYVDPDAFTGGSLSHGGEHTVFILPPDILRCARPFPVEKSRHLRSEEYRRSTGASLDHCGRESCGVSIGINAARHLKQGRTSHAGLLPQRPRAESSFPCRSRALMSSKPP